MAIKDRLNRLLSRKSLSLSSASSSAGDETPPLPSGAVTPLSSPASPVVSVGGEPLSKASSRLAKTLTWRSNRSGNTSGSNSSGDSNKPVKPAKQPKSILKNRNNTPRHKLHPSERPLTEANLRQQELLSAFTMTFGRRQSTGGWSSYSGISPCQSRHPSFDAGVARVEDRSGSE